MFNLRNCDGDQRQILDRTPFFLLSPEEQVSFHFMMHLRHKLKSPDFMAAYETSLHKAKLELLKANCPNLTSIDPQKAFIPLNEYDLTGVSPKDFQAMINDPQSPPVIAKGLIKDSVAVKTWTHQSLMQDYGDVKIVAWEYGTATSAAKQHFEKLRLADILRSQMDDTPTSYYVNNSSEIFADHPQLADDMGSEKILELFKGHSINTFNQLFVGSLKTWGTNWHLGNAISCALMINGKKRWYFMDPRLTYVLKPFFNGSNGLGTQTEIRRDLSEHLISNPLYVYAPKFYVDIEPGDVIFFNKFWPHSVINMSPLQIMSNMRMTEVDLENMTVGREAPTLLPVYDNILNSDPEFIKFKFEIFKNLGLKNKTIADSNYFSGYSTVKDSLVKENVSQ